MKIALLALLLWTASAVSQTPGELRFCLRSDPKTFDPLQVTGESGDTIRYLTAGVLLRVNRATQKVEPELAEHWTIQQGGRCIRFRLRAGVRFSDGTPFDSADVASTLRLLLDAKLGLPAGDSFRRSGRSASIEVAGPRELAVSFPDPIAGLEVMFDEIPIVSSRSPAKQKAVLGPFFVAEYEAGNFLLLRRNPNYWKKDERGKALPYLDAVRIEFQQNREIELLRFRRGEIHFISSLELDAFEQLTAKSPQLVRDAGATIESEVLGFNQKPDSPLAGYKKKWFRSRAFRRAISESIHREDLVRLVYNNHAAPGFGPFPAAAKPWTHPTLHPHRYDPAAARKRLEADGFRAQGETLVDSSGNVVEFSIITNAGNRNRARLASLIQQDLAKVGMKINLVTLEFPSLVERISRTFHYEAVLLGIVGVDTDPNDQLNIWLSSSSSHQWNPRQAAPETPWEAEIDRLMTAQAGTYEMKKRQALVYRMQEIVWEEAPLVYLVHPNALLAVSAAVKNAFPVVSRPRVHWNVERLWLAPATAPSGR